MYFAYNRAVNSKVKSVRQNETLQSPIVTLVFQLNRFLIYLTDSYERGLLFIDKP